MEFREWLITESLDNPLPIRWTKRNNKDWQGTFIVPVQNNNNNIVYPPVGSIPQGNSLNHTPNVRNRSNEGKQYIIRMMKDPGMPWEVKFELVVGDKRSQEITGTGDAAVVASTVLSGIKQWLSVVNPTSFAITAREENRQRLYLKMIPRYLGKEWAVEDMGGTFFLKKRKSQLAASSGRSFSDDDFAPYFRDE